MREDAFLVELPLPKLLQSDNFVVKVQVERRKPLQTRLRRPMSRHRRMQKRRESRFGLPIRTGEGMHTFERNWISPPSSARTLSSKHPSRARFSSMVFESRRQRRRDSLRRSMSRRQLDREKTSSRFGPVTECHHSPLYRSLSSSNLSTRNGELSSAIPSGKRPIPHRRDGNCFATTIRNGRLHFRDTRVSAISGGLWRRQRIGCLPGERHTIVGVHRQQVVKNGGA